MRHIPLLTIDPPDARDHDDAVWATPDDDPKNQGGFKIIVAIADVSFYVRNQSKLDEEAKKRGNSTYLPDRVVPMLPERLSTELCSLKENVDRPALACFMTFTRQGRKVDHHFDRIIMRSVARLSYRQAQDAIDGKPGKAAKPLLEDVLKPLWAAYAVLKKGRDKRQPLELELPERKLIVGENGLIEDVMVAERFDAHKLIEEFMIQANVAAAEALQTRKVPLIYRVHDAPSAEKLKALADFLKTLNLTAPRGQVMKPSNFNTILAQVKGKETEHVVNQVVLRSQSQAIYSTENLGHFGLNLRNYAHFTSPIRRYADLTVHRGLISAFNLGDDGLVDDQIAHLEEIAQEISKTERRSMLAERATKDRMIAMFLSTAVNQSFRGRISGVSRAGLFIILDNSGADGFVPAAKLDGDYFIHDETGHALVGERTGETFRIGDKVTVRLMEAVPVSGGLRFEMMSKGSKGKPVRKRHKRFSGRKQRKRR
jgi:ribonuclease R